MTRPSACRRRELLGKGRRPRTFLITLRVGSRRWSRQRPGCQAKLPIFFTLFLAGQVWLPSLPGPEESNFTGSG
jgi:hypothetical protein